MYLLKRLFTVVVLVSCIALGMWLYADNRDPVTLTLLGYALPAVPLALWIISTFAAGVAAGMLASLLPLVWHRRRLRKLERSSAQLQAELDALRALSSREHNQGVIE